MRFRPLLILLICFVSPSLTRIHQMLKKGLLQQLGLEKEPELARPTLPVPDHVWSLYEDVMEERNHADWIRHYYPQSLLEENSGLFLSFNLSLAASKQEQVTRAELRLKLRANQIGYIYVFSGQNFTENVASLVSTTEPWTIVDISKAFVGQQPELLEMRIAIPPDVKLEAPEAHTVSQMAFVKKQSVSLIVYSELQEPSRVRRKRSTAAAANQVPTRRRKGRKQHRLGVDKNLCQLKELYVDFEELNWQDWILAPKGYEAGQCGGNCPHPIPAHLNATNHAIIQSLLHSLNPQIPPPCCVPTETSSLAILYMDMENRIVIKNYPDMRVEACGCR